MTRMERPPRGLEYKTAAVDVPTFVPRTESRGVEYTVVILPIGVEQAGDVFEPGALADAMTRRTPKITIDSDWNRPVGTVVSATELPPADPRLPATQPDGTPWPPSAGGLLLRLRLMPSTTTDSALAVKMLRRNGARQRWQIGFKVSRSTQRGPVRHIKTLEIYSLSPRLDGPGETKSAARFRRLPGAPPMEVKALDGASVPVAAGRRWALTCEGCGRPVALADRPLPTGTRMFCAACVDSAGSLVDPFADSDLDDPQAPDPGPVAAYGAATAAERGVYADGSGVIRRGPRV